MTDTERITRLEAAVAELKLRGESGCIRAQTLELHKNLGVIRDLGLKLAAAAGSLHWELEKELVGMLNYQIGVTSPLTKKTKKRDAHAKETDHDD